MGKYINKVGDKILPSKGKVNFLIENAKAVKIPAPTVFGEGLVCVVDNVIFEAAGYAFDEREMQVFLYPDGRRKQWLLIPNASEIAQ